MQELPVLVEDADPGTPLPEWDTDRLVTYSRSLTIDLTYRCLARCGYCEYRSDTGGLIAREEVDRLLDPPEAGPRPQTLGMFGQNPWRLPRPPLPYGSLL